MTPTSATGRSARSTRTQSAASAAVTGPLPPEKSWAVARPTSGACQKYWAADCCEAVFATHITNAAMNTVVITAATAGTARPRLRAVSRAARRAGSETPPISRATPRSTSPAQSRTPICAITGPPPSSTSAPISGRLCDADVDLQRREQRPAAEERHDDAAREQHDAEHRLPPGPLRRAGAPERADDVEPRRGARRDERGDPPHDDPEGDDAEQQRPPQVQARVPRPGAVVRGAHHDERRHDAEARADQPADRAEDDAVRGDDPAEDGPLRADGGDGREHPLLQARTDEERGAGEQGDLEHREDETERRPARW